LKVLFDTNVVLDVLLDRRPFASVGVKLFARVERGELEGFLGATTLTTVHYLLAKEIGTDEALIAVRRLLSLFQKRPWHRYCLVEQAGYPPWWHEDLMRFAQACERR
jgi:predicted nucleic acid-binding protein